jgi:predicted PurR-regulated permease PerM
MMIGVIVAVMALIPMFGVTIGIIIGAFLILTVNPTQAVWFVVMMIIIQQIEGNLIYPRVAGSVMGLPALWVMTSIIVGGKVFGFVGMLVIVPIVSVIYTILRRVVHVRLRKRKIPKNKIKTSKVLVTTPIHAVNPNSEKGREAKSVIGSLKKKTTYSIKKHTSNNKKK